MDYEKKPLDEGFEPIGNEPPPSTAPRRGRPPLDPEERNRRRRERDRARRERERAGLPSANVKKGRPRKDTATPKEAAEAPPVDIGEVPELDELRAAYGKEKASEAPDVAEEGEEAPASNGVNGYVLLTITDTLMPMAIGFAMRRDPKGMHLTADERGKVEPIADAAAKEMLGDVSPVKLFFLTMASIYAGKAATLPKIQRKAKGAKALEP